MIRHGDVQVVSVAGLPKDAKLIKGRKDDRPAETICWEVPMESGGDLGDALGN